jgi:hypothetical protein
MRWNLRMKAAERGIWKSTELRRRRPAPSVGDLDSNLRRFFAHDFPAVRNSCLNADEIAATSVLTDIVPTGGRESRGQWEYRCAEQVAHKLNLQLIDMPGGHNGLVSHPWATAAILRRLFTKENPYETRNQRVAK